MRQDLDLYAAGPASLCREGVAEIVDAELRHGHAVETETGQEMDGPFVGVGIDDGADDGDFADEDIELRDAGNGAHGGDAEDEDLRTASGDFDGELERGRGAGGFDNGVEAGAVGDIGELFAEGGGVGIEGEIGAEGERGGAAVGVRLADDDGSGAGQLGEAGENEPGGSGADDEQRLAGFGGEPVHAVDAAGGGFDEAAEPGVEAGGQFVDGAGGNDEGFGEAAIQVHAEGLFAKAEMFLPLAAEAAGGAVDVGFDGDDIAFAHALDTRAESLDDAGDFVAEDDAAGCRELAAENVCVGAADADDLGPETHFTGGGGGQRQVLQMEFTGGVEEDALHARAPGRGTWILIVNSERIAIIMQAGLSVVCIGVATHDVIAVARDPLLPDGRIVAEAIVEAGGGNAATAAVALARLGVAVEFIGALGDDATGATILKGLAAEGVGVSGVCTVAGGQSPASVIVVNPATAQRSIVTLPAAGLGLRLRPEDLEACRRAAWIHVDYAGYRAVAELRRQGIRTPVSLDAGNAVPGLELSEIALYAPTRSELCRAMGTDDVREGMRRALAAGPRIVAVTMGEAGSVAAVRSEDGNIAFLEARAFPVEAMGSTLGAGDVFHGTLVAGLALGRDVKASLVLANAAAALACRGVDGRSAIPSARELEAFVASFDERRA